MALAVGSDHYTPPVSVVQLRRRMAMLPALYAMPGDAILVVDNIPDTEICQLEHFAELKSDVDIFHPYDKDIDWSAYRANPWGWNHQIARFLHENCPGLTGIPDRTSIDTLRKLAHRSTTIDILTAIPPEYRRKIYMPLCLNNIGDVMNYCSNHQDIFIKAPWSSSGRGIIRTAGMSAEQVEQWSRGIIRSQGSVLVEHAYNKVLDFATEWNIENGVATFLGVSVFHTSNRGKYQGNITGSQQYLMDVIMESAPRFGMDVINTQRSALQSVIGDKYNGPLGIDMMVCQEGDIHPCVEINLRHTMGSIIINNRINHES